MQGLKVEQAGALACGWCADMSPLPIAQQL
jgi:hypothetical protein